MLDAVRVASALDLVNKEHQKTVEEHGKIFNSKHEAIAVLQEEFDELSEEFHLLEKRMSELWLSLRDDSNNLMGDMRSMATPAVFLICEAVQVMAMVKKFQESIEAGYKE